MSEEFTQATLGNTGLRVHRLGLSATYRPGKHAIRTALEHGINFLFCFGFDTQMTAVLREVLATRRESFVIATGAYNLILGYPNLERTLDKRLRQLGTDYIDVFLFLGVLKQREFPERAREELLRLRETGKIRSVGISSHDLKLAGRLAADGALDVVMVRYNAANRGAETDVFPHVQQHDVGVVGYTATGWRYLLRRPPGWPRDSFVPTAGMCYRFALSSPEVDVCLTAPTNCTQLEENLAALEQGPLSAEELELMRSFGDTVRQRRRLFR
jgi:aryl-alcohol dehydrogenase-like predicted oxidoreductase